MEVTKPSIEPKKSKPSNAENCLEPLFNQFLQEEVMLPVMAARASYNVSIDIVYFFYILLIHFYLLCLRH